jgi:hypothetical protein
MIYVQDLAHFHLKDLSFLAFPMEPGPDSNPNSVYIRTQRQHFLITTDFMLDL